MKRIIFGAIILGLGCVFFLQKQHERKEALELKKRAEAAIVTASATPPLAGSPSKSLPKLKPTPVIVIPPTSKPKPTPMLPKPTPMLGRTP